MWEIEVQQEYREDWRKERAGGNNLNVDKMIKIVLFGYAPTIRECSEDQMGTIQEEAKTGFKLGTAQVSRTGF